MSSLATSIPMPSDPSGDSGANPFAADVCADLFAAGWAGEDLHEEAMERLRQFLESRGGAGVVLLTAPRAGYGKTHLLGRLAAAMRGSATLMPVRFGIEDRMDLTTVCRRGLESLHRAVMGRAGWTGLREVSSGVVASLVRGLIESGRLACANQEQALRVLQGPVEEVFDQKGRARPIGEWVRQNREQLRAPMATLASEKAAPGRGIAPQWVEALLEQAVDGGVAGLATMHELAGVEAAGDGTAWLRLASLVRPVVVVVDHVDGLHEKREAGVSMAALSVELAEVHGVKVVLSVNQDVWQSSFGGHLPSALEDRLTAAQVSLRGLTAAAAQELTRARLEEAGVSAGEAAEFGRFLAIERFFLGRPLGSVPVRAFLRHAARQWEMFKTSLPAPEEAGGAGYVWQAEGSADGQGAGVVPMMPEAATGADAGQVPAIFDEDTAAYVKEIAGGLAHAGGTTADPGMEERREPNVESREAPPEGMVAPSPDAFEKLREMLGKLRQPSAAGGAEGMAAAAEAPSAAATAVAEPPASERGDALLGRYEALRLQMRAEAEAQPLDLTRVAELIRLAGRRFPLVRFTEHELPGMAGRPVMNWALQGVEIVFGMANFSDATYWRTVSGFVAGRVAETQGSGVKVKLVAFKSDREQGAFQALQASGLLAGAVGEAVDAVHLDSGSVASLYAMQRIIKEAEVGTLQVEPAQVMSALARELDFFWRRVTRLG